MATIKRRGKRVGPKHRIYITLALPTFEALRAEGEKLGYSVSALAQRVIDRGVAAGLLYGDTPSPKGENVVRVTKAERFDQLNKELDRLHDEHTKLLKGRIEILHDCLDLKEQMIAQMQQGLEEYAETITQQARDIDGSEHARIEAAGPVAHADDAERLDG